jgi:trehalose 6-phosphate phosphatase
VLTQQLIDVLKQKPLGLVFDIDGTLSPIAPTPDKAQLYPGVAELLEQARDHPGLRVAIITGRAVENGAALVNIDGLTYIGSHGLEWSDGLPSTSTVQIAPEVLAYVEPGKQLLALAEEKLADISGILVEHKRVGGAIHYRLCANQEQARQRILTLLAEPARNYGLRLSEGKMVVEIKTPLAIDKGKALRRVAEQYKLHGVVFAGDDRTDLDAIHEIARLRQDGLAAYAIVVKHTDTLPTLLASADLVVDEVAGMAALLRDIVAHLS